MAGYTYSKRKKQVKTVKKQSIQARKNIDTEYELPAAPYGLKHVDPVYMLTDGFAKRFDAVGTEHSRQMAGNSEQFQRTDGENSSTGGGLGSRKVNDREPTVAADSRRESDECNFADKFSSYAFRGGKLANAVMAGQGRQVFTVCLSRALGRSFHGSERQKKLLGSANDFHVGNTSARVMFNRDAQSAVSLVTDALRGSTRILELFRNLANGSDQRSDTPLEMRNIDTLKMAFPFLQTDDDKRLLLSCKSRLKELENSKNLKSENAARLLRAAVIKHTAVLRRKEEQQRNFLTKLNEINSNVREAEKLFSSDGFAEQALREAEELIEGTPPDDDKRRKASFEAASAVADFFSGLRGDENGTARQNEANQPETGAPEKTTKS